MDNASTIEEMGDYLQRKWSESVIRFVVAISICLLSSPKYETSYCPECMEATGYLPLQFLFGKPTSHSLAGNWHLIGWSLAP